MFTPDVISRIRGAVNRERLTDTAVALVGRHSPTRQTREVADLLADILRSDGFVVERPEANWPESPAVAVRWHTEKPGRTLQFDGHLDTVPLPYTPPRIENGILYGQGSADMKGGVAAAVEALRALRDSGLLPKGGILFTAHDHHEGPWGDNRQIEGLIDAGYTGDGVLIPEYLHDRLPVAGRGQAVLEIAIRREGEKIHEVLRPPGLPDVIGAGAEVVRRLKILNTELARTEYPYVGTESVFVGQIHSGEIFNQSPVECRISGSRRWVAGRDVEEVRREFYALLDGVSRETGASVEGEFIFLRDGYRIDENDPLVSALQGARVATGDLPLPLGAKPFVDDGNTLCGRGGIPAITHGPAAHGAHTTEEWVPVSELVRIAELYALTALTYC
ncbi:MAG: M20/M25/M40 family metallo-hydrolase [candidate division Zixibacteria bacterium]|nr:M20/M25/M40 family metallo-hydrolase [candidate division Zixibacteria bacterium]